MTFEEILKGFRTCSALVLGDLMLDEYIFGNATRISQEAPVMVVRQSRSSAVPGGAANVAKNLNALGARTTVVGVVGADHAGETLRASLAETELSHAHLEVDASRPTTRKTRVLADAAHQVLRIDHETHAPINSEIEARLLGAVVDRLPDLQVVLISDYRKGAITEALVRETVKACRKHGVIVVANVKPESIGWYANATLVSLNRPEAAAALGWREFEEQSEPAEAPDAAPAAGQRAACEVRKRYGMDHVLVTLGGQGMATEDGWTPPHHVDVFDTAGAGDTTIATVALGLATAGFRPEVFALAARTAASVVMKVGVAVPTADDLDSIRRS